MANPLTPQASEVAPKKGMVPGHEHHLDCDHHHHHHDAAAHRFTDTRRLIVALIVIGSFALVEIIGGVISNSLALIADAGHMVTDFAAIALALGARWLAARPATGRFTFGLKRAQILAAFVNALALFALIAWLMLEGLHRLQNPSEILSGWMLVVAVLGLGANLVAFWVLHGSSHGDMNMRGATAHVMGDILGSIAAILAAIIIKFTGWVAIDPILTMLVCVLIARSAWHLLKESTHVLMQGTPAHLDPEEIRQSLLKTFPEVCDVHHLNVWMLTEEAPYIALHAVVPEMGQRDEVLRRMGAYLREEYQFAETTIQVENQQACAQDASLDGVGGGEMSTSDQAAETGSVAKETTKSLAS